MAATQIVPTAPAFNRTNLRAPAKGKPGSLGNATSPGAAASYFAQEAKAALSKGQAAGGDTIMQAVKHCFGRWPEDVLIPLEHSYKVLQWMEVLSSCISDTLASESADSAIPKAKTLADIAKWIASETTGGYLDTEIEDMKGGIKAAQVGGVA